MAGRNLKLVVSYEGTRYHGWQRQVGQITIQEVMERAISTIVSHRVKLFAAGRTDSGVHALGQICNFHTSSPIGVEELKAGLNSLLPDDIRVLNIHEVPDSFHSRYSAKRKTYVYRILNAEEPDIFARRYEWHIPFPLDLAVMNECLVTVLGKHDFSSFRSSGSSSRSAVRTMFRAEVARGASPWRVMLLFEADGFLRHMVRNIVGTVAEVGIGKISTEDFKQVLEAKDRAAGGRKAPPNGLFLVRVVY